MKLLTREELDEIETRMLTHRAYGRQFSGTIADDCFKLLAAARRSIPRPIAEAPRDGKRIFGKENNRWYMCFWCGDESYGHWVDLHFCGRKLTEFIPIPEPADG